MNHTLQNTFHSYRLHASYLSTFYGMLSSIGQALVLTHGYFCDTQTYTNTTQDFAVVQGYKWRIVVG